MDLTAADVERDFAEVTRQLEEVHADFVEIVGEEAYRARREETRSRLADVHDDGAFWWTVAPLVAAAGDGHSDLRPPDRDVARQAGWDLDLDLDGIRIRGFGRHAGPSVPEGGARLVSLDGIPGERIAAELLARASGETDVFRQYKAKGWFWAAADTAVTALGGERHTGAWHVVLELPGGRLKEGVVAPLPVQGRAGRPHGYLNTNLVDPSDSPWSTHGRDGVLAVTPLRGGAGYRAGLRDGDLIVSIDGHPVGSFDGALEVLSATEVGQRIAVDVVRDGEERRLEVRLGKGRDYDDPVWFSRSEDALWVQLASFDQTESVLRQLDERLEDLEAHGLHRVVVDLRQNGGGDADLAEGLCQRLCRRPYPPLQIEWRRTPEAKRMMMGGAGVLTPLAWLVSADVRRFLATPTGEDFVFSPDPPKRWEPSFDGDVVVLVDSGSYSASVYATWLLQRYADAEVVGVGPGSGTWFHGQQLWTRLERSHLALTVATSTFHCDRDGGPEPVEADRPMHPQEAFHAVLGR